MKRLDKSTEIADLLHSAALHLMRWIRIQDESLGVSPARLSALSVIVFGGPISLKKLAEIEQVKPPTMTKIVDNLEEAGLVRRETNREDQRAIVISPTQTGILLIRNGRRKRVEYLAGRIRELRSGDIKAVEAAAKVIHKIIGMKVQP